MRFFNDIFFRLFSSFRAVRIEEQSGEPKTVSKETPIGSSVPTTMIELGTVVDAKWIGRDRKIFPGYFEYLDDRGEIVIDHFDYPRYTKNGDLGPDEMFDWNGTKIRVDFEDVLLSWRDMPPKGFIAPGDTVRIRITGYDYYWSHTYIGSLNFLNGNNPYQEIGLFPPTTVFRTVYDHERSRLIFPNGAESSFSTNGYNVPIENIHDGDEVDVAVTLLFMYEDGAELFAAPLDKLEPKRRSSFERLIRTNADFDVVRPGGKPDFQPMLKHGSIVEASFLGFDDKESFQLFEYQGTIVSVDNESFSWTYEGQYFGKSDLSTMNAGDFVKVFITGYNYNDDTEYIGSVRATVAENPFREISRFVPNTVFRGTVYGKHPRHMGIAVILPNGAHGQLGLSPDREDKLEPGTQIDVVVNYLFLNGDMASIYFKEPTDATSANNPPK